MVQHFWNFVGATSIRVKVLGIVIGIVLILGAFVTVQIRQILRVALTNQLEEQGLAISDLIATDVETRIANGDSAALQDYLIKRQRHFSDTVHVTPIDYIFVVDNEGQIIAHTFEDQVPSALFSEDGVEAGLGSAFDIATQIDQENAVLHLGLSESRINDALNSVTRHLIYATILTMVAGFVGAVMLTWVLTRPIMNLVETAKAVEKGDFSRRAPHWANDEIGKLAEAFNAMTEALALADRERRESEQLRTRYVADVIRVQEEERRRVALELHDSTSQSLTALLIGLRNLAENNGEASLKNHAEDLRKQVVDTLDEVNRLARQLRPAALDDLGLQAALQHHITDAQNRYQLHIDFLMYGIASERLPAELETNIYRIVQEALTNIARHAGAATASVLIEKRSNSIRIIVEDDGKGFDPAPTASAGKSLGLRGIEERARLFGGKMTIESVPEQGTSLFVELPTTQFSVM